LRIAEYGLRIADCGLRIADCGVRNRPHSPITIPQSAIRIPHWSEATMGPMDGVTVVELGVWVAGPSCAGILCDWGADVIKIEPPEGDPFRGILALRGPQYAAMNPLFELDNRGKRSVALNLRDPRGRDLAFELIDRADVFVTNQRPGALARLGLTYENLARRNPRLIYAHITGYGPESADADRAAYDVGAFWSRAGVASLLRPPGQHLPIQRGGMGDHTAGSQAAGAVAAALYHRERSGRGQKVAVSLARTGAYMIGWDLNLALRTNEMPEVRTRDTFPNPLILDYRTADDRELWLLMLQGDRHWPDFCRAVGHEEWLSDERFRTLALRAVNCAALVDESEAVMRTRTLAEWAEIFDREGIWFAPVQSVDQVLTDPVMAEAGAWVDVPTPDGPVPMVASPMDFYGTPWAPRGPAPELGQHTEDVLLELGHDWDEITLLKDAGVIP
jgi:crotonobetainyl-CoA:carnitine CoA-transferase CaiB-like acyl-CoA transferase